jgi:hypothetical protein
MKASMAAVRIISFTTRLPADPNRQVVGVVVSVRFLRFLRRLVQNHRTDDQQPRRIWFG